jgi:hypothetical protein
MAVNTLEKVAEYIGRTQPVIDRYNENRAKFVQQATKTAAVLVARGLLDRSRMDAFIDKVAADETGGEVFAMLEKLAGAITGDSLGSPAGAPPADGMDMFERWAVYGSPYATGMRSGMVD